VKVGKSDADKNSKDEARQAFLNIAGADGEIDAYELQNLLNNVFKKGLSLHVTIHKTY
jgi:calpain, invertebrate